MMLVIITSMFSVSAGAASVNFDPGFDLYSDYVYLVNLDTDTPIYQKMRMRNAIRLRLQKL